MNVVPVSALLTGRLYTHPRKYPWHSFVLEPDMGLTANILNKQSWTTDKGWPYNLGVRREANAFIALKMTNTLQNTAQNLKLGTTHITGNGDPS
jgi:hypothetical protein